MMKWVTHWLISQAKPGGEAIELGCGKADVAIALAQKGFSVTAVDYDASALDEAKGVARSAGVSEMIEWLCGDIGQLSMLTSETYATVVLSFVLHHVENPAKALSEAWRLLEPEGRLLIAEMLPRGPQAGDSCHTTPLGKWLALFSALAPNGLDLHIKPEDEHVLAVLTKPSVTPTSRSLVS